MQFLNYVLLQIDEACRFIKDGRLAQLRIALLLLDNAAEIQMHRCATNHLLHEEQKEHVRSSALLIPEGDREPILQELVQWEPLNAKGKRAVHKYFDEKVKYLTKRAEQLDPRLAAPLCYLHKYRNEAYHHARVRKETIETAAKLLLDINCELLLQLSRGWTSYGSDRDYSWLKERFCNESVHLIHHDDLVPNAVSEFRAVIDLSDKTVANLLVYHLRSRIQDVFGDLEFIVENTRFSDIEAAIRASLQFSKKNRKQYW